jgi:hypothetical protein
VTGGDGGTPLRCPPGSALCGDICSDLRRDRDHCGSCAESCARDELCDQGTCACKVGTFLELVSHVPNNGQVAIDPSSTVDAVFNCGFDRRRASADSARLWGGFSGPIPLDFPNRNSGQLVLDPKPRPGQKSTYLAGELLTVWLGERLGTPQRPFRPYLWQFTAEVSAKSPGTFRAGAPDLSAFDRARQMTLGDVDADGDLDVVALGASSLVLLRNHGDASFDPVEPLSGTGAPALGDVDGDGDLDLANGEELLLNDGAGHFAGGPAAPGCIAFGDLDGDGDQDCVASLGLAPGATQELLGNVLFNAGDGSMSAGDQTPFGFECQLADLDADGDLDAVCVPPVVAGARAFFNDGYGVFAPLDRAFGEAGARGIALGDVDADGDVDLVVSHWFGGGKAAANLLFLNDGRGTFSSGSAIGGDGGQIALADLDGDGDLDLVYSHLTPYGPIQGPFNPASISLNDGRGHFKASQGSLGDPAFHWFRLGDLDGDGDLDAFVFHQLGQNGNYSSVWLNQD